MNKTLYNVGLGLAIALMLCLFPMPYGYFTIVRIVTTIISGYLAYNYYTESKKELALAFAVIAVLFQPFIKFAFGREVWLVVDIIVAILLLYLAIKKK
jgi:hypothetical protein